MDIHKPKPWHGLREFLKEYIIIVAGVLTALAGEQAVEWMHWRHEVSEAERALKSELGRDLAAWEFRVGESDCVNIRIADLERWRESWTGAKGVHLTAPIRGPISFNYFFESWDVAQTGQVAAHIPLERRMLYAKSYALFRQAQAAEDLNRDSWRSLREFDDARSLDNHDLMRLTGIISSLKGYESSLSNNLPVAQRRLVALGAETGVLEGLSQSQLEAARAALCKSILPS